jgi:protein TonB
MRPRRARSVLLWAIAISLIVHLLIAGYIRWPFQSPNEEPRVAKVHIITVARIPPHTPPPPTPAPVATVTPLVRASVAPPHTTPVKNAAPGVPKAAGPAVPLQTPGASTPAPTATPVATASPSACVNTTRDPAVSSTPGVAEIPPEVRAAKISGTAAIAVSLDAQGRVLDAKVAQSTGNTGLDAVATEMARNATYTPKTISCKAVASTYTFTVKFSAW